MTAKKPSAHYVRWPAWADRVWLHEGDVEAAVRELKAKPGRELQVHGSGDLLRWLLGRDLVVELNLQLYPVVVGDGLRLFPEQGQTHDLTLVESRSTPSGVTIQTYRSTGRPRDLRHRRLRAQHLGAARHRTSRRLPSNELLIPHVLLDTVVDERTMQNVPFGILGDGRRRNENRSLVEHRPAGIYLGPHVRTPVRGRRMASPRGRAPGRALRPPR